MAETVRIEIPIEVTDNTDPEDIARKMTFGDNIEAVTKFSDASAEVEQTYSNMEAAISNMDKLNWKARLREMSCVIGCFRVTATIPAKIRTRYWHGP